MDMFEYGKALASLWTLGGQAVLSAQENAARALSERMTSAMTGAMTGAVPGMAAPMLPQLPQLPDLSGESADLTRATQAAIDMWSAAGELAATIATRLPKDGAPGSAAEDGSDPIVAATFRKMLDPRAWLAGTGEMDEMLSRMAEGPRFADLWDVERRYTKVFQAWMAMRRRSLEHNAVTLEGWLRAGRSFAEQLGTKDKRGADAKALFDLWIETANRALIETQRSEPYLRTQAALIRASTDLKMAQRELAEYYGERFGFPTRTELDDVHRTVTELRRELRALHRRLDGQTAPVQHAPQPGMKQVQEAGS